MTRQELVVQAYQLPLHELAKMVVRGSFTPGIHDSILIERCEATDDSSN